MKTKIEHLDSNGNKESEYVMEYCTRCVKETQHLVIPNNRFMCMECKQYNVRRNFNNKIEKGGITKQ